MLYRVFIVSNMALFLGLAAVFLGDYLLPGAKPIAMPVGALIAGISGIVFAVSGIALVWPNDRS